jgi:glycosyltransferase involved in cell wall biosynthesis
MSASTPESIATESSEPVKHPEALDGVSIIIPTYNESKGVAFALDELLASLDELDPAIEREVIVVDDGSKDDTAEQIARFESDRLRVIRHPENRGYGAAIKTGVAAARHPWVMITDADGTYPPSFIAPILEQRGSYDMVVGARTGESTSVPLLRRPPKWVLRKLASYLSERRIPDLNSGLRVMRRQAIQRFQHILPNQFSFTTTITLAMLSAGLPVKYLAIDYRKRKGKSKIRPIADTIGFLQLIVRTIMYFSPLRVFLPISLMFFLAAIGVGVTSYALTPALMDVTTVLLFVTSVHMLALGMIADTINRRLP